MPDIQGTVTGARKQNEEKAVLGYLGRLAAATGGWFIDPIGPPGKQCKVSLGIPWRQGGGRAYFY